MMAEMLSYKDSWSTAYTWQTEKKVAFADENYAREIMQLFTIGFDMLSFDGSEVVDSNGNPAQSYTNEEILEYARVWTGFTQQSSRGNIELLIGNRIDPMTINMTLRDRLPKMGLNRKYVGDGIPLCADLPDVHFLKRGATYRLLGRSKSPEFQTPDPIQWKNESGYKYLAVHPNGVNSLFTKLCGSQRPTDCNFASKVVLDHNLPCNGAECAIDTIRTVEVTGGIFYEYERTPCVYQAFYDNPVAVVRRDGNTGITCADPRTEAASIACCNGSTREWNDTVSLQVKRLPHSAAFPNADSFLLFLSTGESVPLFSRLSKDVWEEKTSARGHNAHHAPRASTVAKIATTGQQAPRVLFV